MVRSLYSIAAVCQNMGIGKDGQLPWPPLRNEYKYFQKMTMTPTQEGKQNVVIMGKRTWYSIPEKSRPLKGRINIVLSKEMKEVPKGAHYLTRSLDEALDLLESSDLASKIDLVWIVGGSSVYKAGASADGTTPFSLMVACAAPLKEESLRSCDFWHRGMEPLWI
ncbi:dihydrofolate reductase [Sceloporus undulatus]|uniref:dihydrofolate reductase n=1 Tax=Sceloporus undulatus TaxID=8520 RepID=UPI001C4C271D|nr:dihydrofolate reductase [Sceloporus undulatus]